MLVDQSLQQFMDEAAARAPTPGGGAIAACCGAAGAAMGAMAARYTEGKKGFEEHEATLTEEIGKLDGVRVEMLALVDDDARAYETVSVAYGLPRGDEEEKDVRRAAIQEALGVALGPPLRACRAAVAGLEVLESLRHHVNPSLASDVAVAAYALGAAARAGWVNVLVNLSGLKDSSQAEGVREEGVKLLKRAAELESAVGSAIEADLA